MHYDPFHSHRQGRAQGASRRTMLLVGSLVSEPVDVGTDTLVAVLSPELDAGEACSALAGRAQRPHGGIQCSAHAYPVINCSPQCDVELMLL